MMRTTVMILCLLCLVQPLYARRTQQADTISFRIGFRQGRSSLEAAYAENANTIDSLRNFLKKYAADSLGSSVRVLAIESSVSPEGTVAINNRLLKRRADVMRALLAPYIDTQNIPVLYRRPQLSAAQRKLSPSEIEAIYMTMRNSEAGISFVVYGIEEYLGMENIVISEEIIPELNTMPEIPRNIPHFLLPRTPKFYLAISTNMLYDLLAVPSAGFEAYLGGNFSLALHWMYAWWNSDRRHRYWRAYGGDAGVRYWFGSAAHKKPLTGHHAGIYSQVLTYDFEFGGRGYMAGQPGGNIFDRANGAVGAEYGYSFPIARRLNIDLSIGIGYMWGKYYEYRPIDNHYVWQATKQRRWFGPTKLEISLVWLIGPGNCNE